MKVLLCAYACEPNRGSEPGIGWKWGYYLALYTTHEVYVLTRSNNRDKIEAYRESNKTPPNLHFFYYDLPSPLVYLKHHGLPVNIYYALWLYGAGKLAYKLHQKHYFDIAHHITFGVFRDASFLYKLHIPYMIGPVGGGESTPSCLYSLYPLRTRIKEYIRIAANNLAMFNPFLIKSLREASIILAKTPETKQILNKRLKQSRKILVQLELGVETTSPQPSKMTDDLQHKFLYVGRFIHWKGIEIILCAFSKYVTLYDANAQLTLIGEGPLLRNIYHFIQKNNLEKNIAIIPWIEQSRLKSYYQNSCALIFPSLHDSSGNVVLEALCNGLPVISLDCGGPACIQGDKLKEMIIPTHKCDIENIVSNVTLKMKQLTTDSSFYANIQQQSLSRAQDFIWKNVITHTYDLFFQSIKM